MTSPEDSAQFSKGELFDSALTVPSDPENYDSRGQPSSEEQLSAVVPYQTSSSWKILRGVFINLFLPFVNGLMLGFGELFAHEAAYRLGWSTTKVFPVHRRVMGPGVTEETRQTNERQDRKRSLFGSSSNVAPSL